MVQLSFEPGISVSMVSRRQGTVECRFCRPLPIWPQSDLNKAGGLSCHITGPVDTQPILKPIRPQQ